jgi:hypothetical protein
MLNLAKTFFLRGRNRAVEVVQHLATANHCRLVGVARVDTPFRPYVDQDFLALPPSPQVIGERNTFSRMPVGTEAKVKHEPNAFVSEYARVGGKSVVERTFRTNAENGVPSEAIPVHKIGRRGKACLLEPGALRRLSNSFSVKVELGDVVGCYG